MLIVAVVVGWRLGANPVLSFWLAYILTRPLGANLGDWFASPTADGGLNIGTAGTSLLFLAAILGTVTYLAVKRPDVVENAPPAKAAVERPRSRERLALAFYGLVALGAVSVWRSPTTNPTPRARQRTRPERAAPSSNFPPNRQREASPSRTSPPSERSPATPSTWSMAVTRPARSRGSKISNRPGTRISRRSSRRIQRRGRSSTARSTTRSARSVPLILTLPTSGTRCRRSSTRCQRERAQDDLGVERAARPPVCSGRPVAGAGIGQVSPEPPCWCRHRSKVRQASTTPVSAVIQAAASAQPATTSEVQCTFR